MGQILGFCRGVQKDYFLGSCTSAQKILAWGIWTSCMCILSYVPVGVWVSYQTIKPWNLHNSYDIIQTAIAGLELAWVKKALCQPNSLMWCQDVTTAVGWLKIQLNTFKSIQCNSPRVGHARCLFCVKVKGFQELCKWSRKIGYISPFSMISQTYVSGKTWIWK